jgi:type I restriction enzyme M protein
MFSNVEIKPLLKALGFTPEEGSLSTWAKAYTNHNNYKIKLHIDEEKIDYGNKIILGDKTTCNFKASENFVVLECVNRLLEKGYNPKNITLEKTWATGHGTSGKLDILVTHDNGAAYLMIECKTYGVEFDKELKRIFKDGGQLFTYFQQDKHADVLVLYASQIDKKGNIQYCSEIVKIEEDYKQTGNVKEFYDRWNKLTKNNGIFDDWVNAYDFQSKALIPQSLKEIKQEDSSFIFNQFLEILRHNVVSDKPNAFNKIFTLFLCKIYDEKSTKDGDELAFQWFYAPYQYEGISYPPDDNISFQKRLTDLYKKGMEAFLDKEVTDISDADFERKYGDIPKESKQRLLNDIVEIRLKKNNEFAIKEVFNDDSFKENAKVVKEVVELLQGFKIRYAKKHQYLSDFFEMLLTTGLKRESGQFFTPVPIAQFIIKSIPLDKIVEEKLNKGERNNLLPTIIDYAAGSGHFVTESMHEIQRIINAADPKNYISDVGNEVNSWKASHFNWAYNYVYGIEKDYRLVKVGKVGCHLHGDDLAQIIHSDGLGNFKKTEEYKDLLKKTDSDFPKDNKQFDIVVSNPPYSVSAFKNNARKYYTEDDFEIYQYLTDQSSEIECLFIERTKQLLKDGGIAGIILPSSILSNTGIYTKAREIILQYFEIVAIAELGSNTFMATGTNTVTLFMRRRNNYDCKNINAAVKDAILHRKDVTINQIEKPVSKYVNHVWEGITYNDYVSLLQKQPNQAIEKHKTYQEYRKKIKARNEKDFWGIVITLEQEKILYFILTYAQKVVLVNSGDKNAEKQFLGYEFSNRRGNEGIHPVQRGKSIDECTQLFDPEVFDNPEKAGTYIYQAFQGNFDSEIHESLQQNITRLDLIDMLTFDRVDFEKNISLAIKKK